MNATTASRDAGQRLWLDTLNRQTARSGTLQRYIDDYGVTSKPEPPERRANQYDDTLVAAEGGTDPEQLVYKSAVADAQRAAHRLRPI